MAHAMAQDVGIFQFKSLVATAASDTSVDYTVGQPY